MTLANLLVYVVMLAVVILGAMVHLPEARREIAVVERERVAAEQSGR